MISCLVLAASLSSLSATQVKTRTQWLPVVKAASSHYGIDWRLMDILILKESSWNPNAISPAGAQGLCQLMPGTAEELGVKDPFDPGQNIWGAAWYLRKMYNRFQDWGLAIASYNAGPSRVAECQCVPPYEETRRYVKEIMISWRFEI